MAVGATNRSGNRAYYSNTGRYVEIAAPGGDRATATRRGNGFIWQSTIRPSVSDPSLVLFPRFDAYAEVGYPGTSMATPHVAGARGAALQRRGSQTPAAIEQLIKKHREVPRHSQRVERQAQRRFRSSASFNRAPPCSGSGIRK